MRALAVDGTSGTVLAGDAAGTPIGPASLYNDPADPALVARIAAGAPPDSAAQGATSPAAKLLGCRTDPVSRWLMHEADWIAGRLCGQFGISDENNALKTGYDPLARRWPDWLAAAGVRPRSCRRCNRRERRLHLSAPPSQPVRTAAHAMVATGTTDGCAAFLATGATGAGEGVTSLGSTLTIKLLSDAPVFAPAFGIYSHRMGDHWLPGGASNSGGAALARHFDADTLARLSARIDPARDSGLDYYPLPGPRRAVPDRRPRTSPRARRRGRRTTRRSCTGLLEGIARIEALAYRRLAELGAPPLARLRTVGGGAAQRRLDGAARAHPGVSRWLPARSEEAAVGTAGLALRALA